MDFYKLIQEQGFNGHTAMDIGCILALSSVEKSKDDKSDKDILLW